MALLMDRSVTRRMSAPEILAVAGGFISCWIAAGYGKSIRDGNLVILAPVISAKWPPKSCGLASGPQPPASRGTTLNAHRCTYTCRLLVHVRSFTNPELWCPNPD